MLSFEEHSGIISFLGGIVILVMAAVGLSLVVDQRLKSSAGSVGIQREIEQDVSALDALRLIHEQRSRHLNDSGTQQKAALMRNEEIASVLNVLGQRQNSLEKTRNQLLDEVGMLEEDFSKYREAYRQKTRAAAVGERLGKLALSGGREYEDAIITGVSDVGLEIRHSDGIARIQAPDLDSKTQERFQWNDEERRKVLKAEMANQEGLSKVPDVIGSASETKNQRERVLQGVRPHPAPAIDRAELSALRRQVNGWHLKIRLLRSEREEAQTHSNYGNSKSVPGSLETWEGRISRLGDELAKAQAALEAAKLNLASVAPSDPLVRGVASEP